MSKFNTFRKMLEISDKTRVPHGGLWHYKDPDSGTTLSHPYWEEVVRMALRHRNANNYPIGLGFERYAEDIICRSTPNGECHEENIGEKALHLARELKTWAQAGMPTVTTAELNARLAICQGCQHYTGKTGILAIFCRLCGCVRQKTQLRTSTCPANKWPILT